VIKRMMFLVVLSLLIMVLGDAQAVNILTNPGFEEGPLGIFNNITIPGWQNSWGATGEQHDYAGRTIDSKAVSLATHSHGDGVYQDFDVTEGEEYVFSVEVRDDSSTPLVNQDGVLWVIFFDDWAYTTWLYTQVVDRYVFDVDPDDEWITLSASVVAPAGAQVCRIYFMLESKGGTASGNLDYDNARVELASDIPPPLMASNPSPGHETTQNPAVVNAGDLEFDTTYTPTITGIDYDLYWQVDDANDANWGSPAASGSGSAGDRIAVAVPATITPEHTYYWRVDLDISSTNPAEVGPQVGSVWWFTTVNDPPEVDAGESVSQNAWLSGGSAVVSLAGSVTDDGLGVPPGALTIGWTSDPSAGVSFDPSDDPVTDVTFTAAGLYTLTLSANDGSGAVTDDIYVRVFAEGLDLIASFESSETSLTLAPSDLTPTIVTGGIDGAPNATEGTKVLKCTWTNQPDNKVHVSLGGLNFDLASFDWLFVDIYMPTDLFAGSSSGVVGIYDTLWTGTWYPGTQLSHVENQWQTVTINVSGNEQTGLTTIYAFLLQFMTTDEGTFYLDNIRTSQHRHAEEPVEIEQGLRYEYFTGSWSKLPNFEALEPDQKGFIDNFDITGAPAPDDFGYKFTGFIDIPVRGVYTFYTQSDEGSELYIGGNLVVDNNRMHTSTEESGTIGLNAGKHAITVKYFDAAGTQELAVSYKGPSLSKTAIPNAVLYREVLSGDYNDDGKADLYDLAVIGQQWLSTYAIDDVELLAGNWLEGKKGLQINDGWMYIDGEKFFVKGLGYAAARPPYTTWSQPFVPATTSLDISRIVDGRFNTIRTWVTMSEEELALFDASGLKIIFGIDQVQFGDFGSPGFFVAAENALRSVLAYTKNYDSIVTYLIMNEPVPAWGSNWEIQPTPVPGDPAELTEFWDHIKTIINNEHPGVPVSFSNTEFGNFVDMNLFDMSAYNMYIGGSGANGHVQKYPGMVRWYKNQSPDNPLLITEFGLSVSPTGQGNYGYGGNTLTEQADGTIYMYRSLIDGNAQGGAAFHYLDAWWKMGELDEHDDHPQEWYGFWAQDGETDTARPAWDALKAYNACIVTVPKNGDIYDTKNIPLEFFPHSDIKTIQVKYNDVVVYETLTNGRSWISDSVALTIAQSLTDVTLEFVCLDQTDTTIKTEAITILYSDTMPSLPTIEITTGIDDLDLSTVCPTEITVSNPGTLTIVDNQVDYNFGPHVGYHLGFNFTETLDENPKVINHEYELDIGAAYQSEFLTISAGLSVQYNDFEKRITAQKILQRGTWANPICLPEVKN